MSDFSDTLRYFITEKGTKIYDLTKQLGIDRSTLYQILKGKRNPPSDQQIIRIADYMKLSLSERERLLEQAKISRLGKQVYYQRKGVEQFLSEFPNYLLAYWETNPRVWKSQSADSSLEKEEDCVYLPTTDDVHLAIHRVIQEEAQKKEGHIGLLLQPEENFLFDTLRSIKSLHSIRVEHILCLGTEEDSQEQVSRPIQYLKTILPLYVRRNIAYSALYYYDKVESHFFHNNGFSGMILTESATILVLSDYSRGLVLRQTETVAGMWELFGNYQASCSELFHVEVMDMTDFSQIQQANNVVSNENACYIMEREVCLLPLLTEDILLQYFLPDIPGREEIIHNLAQMLEGNRDMLESLTMHLYFTKDGLEYFASTGRFKELPESVYIPLGPDARVQMLQSLKEYCKRGIYRMLSGKLTHLANNLRLCINGEVGYLMFSGDAKRVIYMFLTEPNLLGMFHDYIENVEEKNFASGDETVQVIEEICEEVL